MDSGGEWFQEGNGFRRGMDSEGEWIQEGNGFRRGMVSIQFNSIQFNTDICTRQLINYHVGVHDEQR